MKKLHTIIGSLLLCSFAFAQNINDAIRFNSKETVNTKKNLSVLRNSKLNLKTTAAGLVSGRFDPGFSVLMFRGEADMTNGVNQVDIGTYVAPVYMDSTVKASFSTSTDYITTMKAGMMFDPQSIIFTSSNDPLFANADTWYLDTVWVGGSYKRTSASTVVDTLVVELTYGDSTLTSNFANVAITTPTNPLSTWGRFIVPKVTGKTNGGDNVFLSGTSANHNTIKVPLTEADTALFNHSDYKPVVVNGAGGLMLSGSNKVGVAFTFVSGAITASNSVVFAAGSSPQTPQTPGTNGFAALQFAQKNLTASSTVNDYQHYFDDPIKGKNVGITLYNTTRYSTSAGFMYPEFVASYWVDFSIHGVSSVGINELEANGAALGQNVPNPFTGESTITYQLAKDANSVLFTVTDVMGRVISSEKGSTNTGSHSIKLGSYAAGIYYYTLNVDGKTATKKMIAQ